MCHRRVQRCEREGGRGQSGIKRRRPAGTVAEGCLLGEVMRALEPKVYIQIGRADLAKWSCEWTRAVGAGDEAVAVHSGEDNKSIARSKPYFW